MNYKIDILILILFEEIKMSIDGIKSCIHFHDPLNKTKQPTEIKSSTKFWGRWQTKEQDRRTKTAHSVWIDHSFSILHSEAYSKFTICKKHKIFWLPLRYLSSFQYKCIVDQVAKLHRYCIYFQKLSFEMFNCNPGEVHTFEEITIHASVIE